MLRAFILFSLILGCKSETKEQKEKREQEEFCDLAHKYVSECFFELKGVRVAPFSHCSKIFAERILTRSCDKLVR